MISQKFSKFITFWWTWEGCILCKSYFDQINSFILKLKININHDIIITVINYKFKINFTFISYVGYNSLITIFNFKFNIYDGYNAIILYKFRSYHRSIIVIIYK
jgi:hypothetical protein